MTLCSLDVVRHRTLLLCLMLVGAAGELNAQGRSTLAGIVRDSAGRLISGAEVSVPALKRSVRTDSAGRFRIDGLQRGGYYIRVRHVGFRAVDMPAGVAGDSAVLSIVMSRVDITLDTVVVKSACSSHGYEGFLCRQRAGGGGVFLDNIAIDSAKAGQVGDLFFGLTGFRVAVRPDGIKYPVATTGWKCVVTIVDGEAVTTYTNLIPVRPDEIIAVEIYEKDEDVPVAYRRFSWRDGGKSKVKSVPTLPSLRCGLVVYWTTKGR